MGPLLVRCRAIAALSAALWVAAHGRADAQSEAELERARAAFSEGVQRMAEERWAEAVERFREVMQVRQTPQVRYNLGVALYHVSHLAEAAELLGSIVDAEELDRQTRREARRLLQDIEPRLAHLTIRLLGDEGGTRVMLDDREIGLDRIGRPIAVDAGTHRVALQRAQAVVASREITLAEGQSAELSIAARPELHEPAAVAPEALSVPEQPRPRDGEGGSLDGWVWVGIGAGAALVLALAIGIGVGASQGGAPAPVQGNLQPGVLDVTLP